MQQLLMQRVRWFLKTAGAYCCLGNRKIARLITLYWNHDAYSGLWLLWNPLFQRLAVSALSFCSPALDVCSSMPELSVVVQSLVLQIILMGLFQYCVPINELDCCTLWDKHKMPLVSVSVHKFTVKIPYREAAVMTKEGVGVTWENRHWKASRCNMATKQFIRNSVTAWK